MSIREKLENVQKRIYKAAIDAGRNPDDVKLIAVSKTKPISMVEEAIECGIIDFGENRPQELQQKFLQIPDMRWHQIGQLQRNKVKYIIDKVTLIHSVDTISLAEEIEKQASKINKVQDILVQVNISGEESKSGVAPNEAIELCRNISKLSHIHIKGLMTISVAGLDQSGNYEIFSKLKELSEDIKVQEIPGVEMQELSMGMTHDFEEAIAAGATLIRVGSGIFGSRDALK